MTDSVRAEILLKALQEAGRYMRKYLPAEMPLGEDVDITRYCLINGNQDPEGSKFVEYFILKAFDDYEDLPESTKKLLIKTNGGIELNTIEKNTEEIESKRFFYAYNADEYQNYLRHVHTALEFKIMGKEQELDNLKTNLDIVEKEMR